MLVLEVFIYLLATCWAKPSHHLHPLSDEFIELINSKQDLWTAGRNFHRLTPRTYISKLAGSVQDENLYSDYEYAVEYSDSDNINTPSFFDARIKWPHCLSLFDIRDQGSCGSCWAVAAASAMTDRYCIQHNGWDNFYFSADDIVTCCKSCGKGCEGGNLRRAWKYYNKVGIVSGGHYNSGQGCKPYEIPPCEHDTLGGLEECHAFSKTPKCQAKCTGNSSVTYWKNKKRLKGSLRWFKGGSKEIQRDILENGPVTTFFEVFEDFLHYKNGVYKHTEGNSIGFHSVKLIGWGVVDGVEYWTAVNSWNTDWGQEGYFMILRGVNHCDIEKNAVKYVSANKNW